MPDKRFIKCLLGDKNPRHIKTIFVISDRSSIARLLREEVQKVKERKEKQRRKEKQEEQDKERKHQVTDWLKEADFELARALDGLPQALASIIDSGRLAPRCKTKV